MESFRGLEVNKAAKQLAVLTCKLSQSWPKEELFGITSQIRRASVSIASNLSEGFGRISTKDTLHFLAIARGSSFELGTQAEIAFELGFLNEEQLNDLSALNTSTCKMLNGLINRYRNL